MNRETVITALRAHESELRAAGVVRLSLFGSTARGEARPDSDVDLLAALDNARPLSLLDVIRIENQISDLLGHAVDLIEEGTLKPRVRQSVDREAMRAF
jgi:predicted nucleotidyltransferase